jgi:hypothetical protein
MNLATLKNKEPKEILSLLSAVSSSLLPAPNIDEPNYNSAISTDSIDSIIKEIRKHLNITDNDYSPSAQSKIFAFLSKEISNIALSDVNISKVKERLGGKGELPLNQYRIIFDKNFESSEALGERKSNIKDIVLKPDKFIHFNAKYLLLDDDYKYGTTLLTKLISTKKNQDKFIQIVLAGRQGDVLNILGTLRAYFTEINLNELNNPMDILKAFINTYGLTFRLGNLTTKLIHNDITELGKSEQHLDLKILDGQKGDFYLPILSGNQSGFVGTNNINSNLSEILLAFTVDISKYARTLRKHNVYISGENWKFPQI